MFAAAFPRMVFVYSLIEKDAIDFNLFNLQFAKN